MKRPLRDPARYRPTPASFGCGEVLEEGGMVGSVAFYCSFPPGASRTANTKKDRLVFSCRKRSVGVLAEEEARVDDEDLAEAYEAVDPNFFDAGYSLAGATGFQVWAGTRLLVESLAWTTSGGGGVEDHPTLSFWRERLSGGGARILELGAGVGVVGASLAAAGAEVLLTDLETLVDNATFPNLAANRNDRGEGSKPCGDDGDSEASSLSAYPDCPGWLASSSGGLGALPIGRGWAGTAPLDWRVPIGEQLSPAQCEGLDLILASDCVWLVSMLDALLDTVGALFAAAAATRPPPTLVMSFQRRDTAEGDDSPNFTTVQRVIRSVEERGWTIECLAWRPVRSEPEHDDDDKEAPGDPDEKEVFVLAVTAP